MSAVPHWTGWLCCCSAAPPAPIQAGPEGCGSAARCVGHIGFSCSLPPVAAAKSAGSWLHLLHTLLGRRTPSYIGTVPYHLALMLLL